MNGDEPSWITDGFGIQGETFAGPNEFRPQWDTKIGVYDIKDAGQNCCGPACPCDVTVSFHDVLLDCGCTPSGTTSVIVTDFAFNAHPETLFFFDNFCPCAFGSDFLDPRVTTEFFFDSSCANPNFTENEFLEFMGVVFVDGVWHVLAAVEDAVIFYGNTNTDPITAITNQAFCTTSFTDWDGGAVMNCLQGTGDSPLRGIGHSGIASITIETICGACCIGHFCEQTTAAQCALNSGIYQGDGTTCDPNPC